MTWKWLNAQGIEARLLRTILPPVTAMIVVSGVAHDVASKVLSPASAPLLGGGLIAICVILMVVVVTRVARSVEREADVRQATFKAYMDHGPFTAFIRNVEGRYLYANPFFARMYNSSAENIIGKTSREIGFPEDFAREVMADDLRVLNTGATSARTVQMQHFDGNTRQWFAVKFPLLDTSGARLLGGVAIDLTARVQAEAAREKAQGQLVNAYKLAALGEMAGNIAHEINNPLAIVQGKARQLCQILRSTPVDTTLAIEFGETISAMALRLVKIVNGLRNVSRLSCNDAMTPKAIGTLIDETVAFCVPKLKLNRIDLSVGTIPADLEVACRPAELSQVLINLISNAADAVEDQEAGWIKIEVSASHDSIWIRVIDSGPGIPKDIRTKIREPYFTTKPVGKGTGLGLSISTRLVIDHEGTLLLDEDAPHTTFVVQLPRLFRHVNVAGS